MRWCFRLRSSISLSNGRTNGADERSGRSGCGGICWLAVLAPTIVRDASAMIAGS